MKTKIIASFIVTIIIGCSSTDKKAKDEPIVPETITTKEYYSNGTVKSVSEMTVDSTLNGLTIWYDSLGRKYGEQLYLNGKLNGPTKSFYNDGQLAKETEYLNDSIVKEKEYNIDGAFLYQYPIDPNEIGDIEVIIANGLRDHFLKNIEDTVKIFAKNLPLINKVVSVKNAKIRGIGPDKYIITPLNKATSVKVILQLKRKNADETSTPIDSTEIQIK